MGKETLGTLGPMQADNIKAVLKEIKKYEDVDRIDLAEYREK